MKIGIIGASLSGLVAGDKLARAGHDVTVIEKNRVLGGRLATRYTDDSFFDYGLPFLKKEKGEFGGFVDHLVQENVLMQWAEKFPLFDGTQLHEINPNRPDHKYFAAREGMNSIANHLKRWVDVKSEVQAGGLTFIGNDRGKKRAWMINLTDISVFECDAVVLAAPAPQAYGLLLTAQDETPAKRIIRVVDDIRYQPRYVLMAGYDHASPDWKGIECENSDLSWIGNESSKQDGEAGANMMIHSSAAFARENYGREESDIIETLLERAGKVADDWLMQATETKLHFWKYYKPINPIDEYFIEMEMEEAPLALIGDYFNGQSAANAYMSGSYLANYWIDKYATVNA